MIHAAIFAHLSADAGLTALVGTRIYPQEGLENAVYPLISYFQVSSGDTWSRGLTGPQRHFRTLWQFDIIARTPIEAIAVAGALRAALDGLVNQTWGGVSIPASLFDDQFNGNFEPAPNVHRIIQQYRICYAE